MKRKNICWNWMKFSTFSLALSALFLASCSQEDDFTPQNEWKDAPITVASAQVGELVATRTATVMKEGDFGLYVSSANKSTSSKYTAKNMKWEYSNDDNTWTTEENASMVYCTGIANDQKVWAYSPYLEEIQEGETLLTLNLPSSGVADWLYSSPTTISNPAINLAFKHLMTKVTVSFAGTDFGSEVGTSPTVTDVSLSGLLEEVTFDLSGAENPLTAATDASYTGSVSMAKNDDGTFSAIILPYEKTDGTYRIAITIGNSKYTVVASLPTVDSKQGFLPGYHYTITIKQVGEDKVEIGNVTETEWTEEIIEDGLGDLTVV